MCNTVFIIVNGYICSWLCLDTTDMRIEVIPWAPSHCNVAKSSAHQQHVIYIYANDASYGSRGAVTDGVRVRRATPPPPPQLACSTELVKSISNFQAVQTGSHADFQVSGFPVSVPDYTDRPPGRTRGGRPAPGRQSARVGIMQVLYVRLITPRHRSACSAHCPGRPRFDYGRPPRPAPASTLLRPALQPCRDAEGERSAISSCQLCHTGLGVWVRWGWG